MNTRTTVDHTEVVDHTEAVDHMARDLTTGHTSLEAQEALLQRMPLQASLIIAKLEQF